MNTLYDSDRFAVVHLTTASAAQADQAEDSPLLERHGFEIVDKRSGKEVYLDGLWAELFQARIQAWQENTPSQEEVEDALAGYAELAHTPVMLH